MQHQGFSPKARWDRRLPAGQAGIPQTKNQPDGSGILNEKIQVLAFFKAGQAYPRMFIWNNKTYKIKAITYNWQERLGQGLISYFSVNTGSDLYQISLNHVTLGWRINKVIE
jgi:hypothetical protein